MIRIVISLAAIALFATTVASSTKQDEVNDKKALGYGIGYMLGQDTREGLEADGVVVDAQDILDGFRAGLHNEDPAIDREELDRVLSAVHEEMARRAVEARLLDDEVFRAEAEANAAASAAFVEVQSKIEGTKSLPNGVLYRVLKEGKGESPKISDIAVVTYSITLPDGTIAHQAADAEIVVADAIKGARLLLQMMRPGANWEIVLPAENAYGLGGNPPAIGPNQALLLNVTLHQVK